LQLEALRAAGLLTWPLGFRGVQPLTRAIATVFSSKNSAILELAPDSKLKLSLADDYWVKLLFRGYRYEPDVGGFLREILVHHDPFLIDCGANIGYWSVLGSAWSSQRVVGVEAQRSTFERLRENAGLNGGRFDCVNAAVWSHDDENLVIVTKNGLGASASSATQWRADIGRAGFHASIAKSMRLDTLCERYLPDRERPLVVKLDVEGSEIPALEGAERVLREREPLLVYEDHGSDSQCSVSEFVMNQLALDVYYCADPSAVLRMATLASIRAVKTNPRRGYNLFACSPTSLFSSTLQARARS
jgi:FkbM family methyltransferase